MKAIVNGAEKGAGFAGSFPELQNIMYEPRDGDPGVGFVHDEKKEWLPVCVNVHPNLRPCDSDVTIQASQ